MSSAHFITDDPVSRKEDASSDRSEEIVAAGSFRAWLSDMRASLRGGGGAQVPCGDCVGCCASSYYIVVRPTDTRALTKIPLELLLRSKGNALLPSRKDGTCPMLESGNCSIYADRPQTCRDYDCRIFTAAGIEAGGSDKDVINRRVRVWRFDYADDAERRLHEAVRSTAAFIRDHRDDFPDPHPPSSPTGVAALAIKAYTVFLDPRVRARHARRIAADILAAARAFDAVTSERAHLEPGSPRRCP